MKKMSLLILASCVLMTACAGHDKCEESSCPCAAKTECACKAKCGCGAAISPMVMPMMQPKTVVVVVPTQKQQRRVFTPEIVYPEPTPCGCGR